MTLIKLNYNNLLENYTDVEGNIISLMSTMENINACCKEISECWEGTTADNFSALITVMKDYSDKVITNFRNTEQYKVYVASKFKSTEASNVSTY